MKLRSAVIIVLSGCGLLAYSGTRLARSWSGLESIAREWPANPQASRRIVATREPEMRNTRDAPPAPLDVGVIGRAIERGVCGSPFLVVGMRHSARFRLISSTNPDGISERSICPSMGEFRSILFHVSLE